MAAQTAAVLSRQHQQQQQSPLPETEEWEMLSQDDQEEYEQQPHEVDTTPVNRKVLRHYESSPNLRMHTLNEDDSYSVVSRPESVYSIASGMSFRDAILNNAATTDTAAAASKEENTKPRRRITPKIIVVKPVRRCSKSTGDLQSLSNIIHEDEILGESDAAEYYSYKSIGVKGRINGSKIRPDEAKRLEIIQYKKDQQRKITGYKS